jgi:excisionase family DNA binding protein
MNFEKIAISPGTSPDEEISTLEAARLLGLAVRSVQLMVDRGELRAWKTPGGHRRISRQSVLRWRDGERQPLSSAGSTMPAPLLGQAAQSPATSSGVTVATPGALRVLLIEDSIHFQNLVALVMQQHFPGVALRVASDAVTGLIMAGEFRPDVLIVDILLPGMDGATLITSLRANAQFRDLQLIVITSLDANQREPYAFALQGLPVIHKPALVLELPAQLRRCLVARGVQAA